jgi:hypothetical protein
VGKCVLDRSQSLLFAACVLRSPAWLYPQAILSPSAGRTLSLMPTWFKAFTISTHESLTTLTKHVPFASVLFPFGKEAGYATYLRILVRVFPSTLSPAFIGSDFLTTTERSAISQPIGLAFPSGYTSPTLFTFALRKLRDFPQSSTRSVPSILTLITSMSLAGLIPFLVFLQDKRMHAKASPFFRRVAQHLRHLWFTLHSGLDFACRPFGFRLAADTLSVLLLRRVGPLLRLRHFKG